MMSFQGSGELMKNADYTCSHSLAEAKGIISRREKVFSSCYGRNKLQLENLNGVYMDTRFLPRKNYTSMTANISPRPINHLSLEKEEKDDFDFCKERLSSEGDRGKVDSVWKANEICLRACAEMSETKRRALLLLALKVCPDFSARAHLMMFELDAHEAVNSKRVAKNDLKKKDPEAAKPIESGKRAVKAGRAFAELICADGFAKGNQYSFVPCRWYVRALFYAGSFHLLIDDAKGADGLFQECLAVDVHDKLGARHKQLICVLLDKNGIRNPRVSNILKAKFGDDQVIDDTFTNWKYTRALYYFVSKGKCSKADKLLMDAIDKNPYVASLLLNHDLSMETDLLMQLGTISEATEYVKDSCGYGNSTWTETEGAIAWLEILYCHHPKAILPNMTVDCSRLLSKGTRILDNYGGSKGIPKSALDKGIASFWKLLDTLGPPAKRISQVHSTVLLRQGLCYANKRDLSNALHCFELALYHCDPGDKEAIKHLHYHQSEVKEDLGNLDGALKHLKFIWERIGRYSTCAERIKRVESKMNNKTSLIPSPLNFGDDRHDSKMKEISDTLQKMLPKLSQNHTASGKMERCIACKRGGVKLFNCQACDRMIYCSKTCQSKAWKSIHKFTCESSKNYIKAGDYFRIIGLKSMKHHNDKVVRIVKADEDGGRFVVEMSKSEKKNEVTQVTLEPQNLEKIFGTCISIHRLKNASHHNGKFATIISYNPLTKRFGVDPNFGLNNKDTGTKTGSGRLLIRQQNMLSVIGLKGRIVDEGSQYTGRIATVQDFNCKLECLVVEVLSEDGSLLASQVSIEPKYFENTPDDYA